MKIGFVGGGTGGHFYPLMAVAEELTKEQKPPRLYYFGPEPYSKEALQTNHITYVYCPAGKLRRYFSVQNFIDVFKNFFGVFVAVFKLFWIYPDVIFSKGGYTSIPILIAARFLMIPVVIHESDAVPGRANKLAASFAKYIAIAHNDVAKYFPKEKTALIGIPLRAEIKNTSQNPLAELGIPADKPLIYITGGSLGAERLNNVLIQSLSELLPHYRIFHQVGDGHLEAIQLAAQSLLADSPLLANYYLRDSLDAKTVALLLDAAAIIVTRAGSTTLFEIAYHGKPAIVVPIPENISRDQRTNAYSYARSGAAIVIEEHNLTPHLLAEQIQSIISDRSRTEAMGNAARTLSFPDAAKKIADLLLSIGRTHGS